MIGMSCTTLSSKPAVQCIEAIAGRFGLWEIFSEADHDIVANHGIFKELLRAYDIRCSVHSPICDINIASINDAVREASVATIVRTMEAASDLGIERVTVHPGLSSMAIRGIEDRYLERAKTSMKVLERASHEHGIVVAVENMPNSPFFLGRTAEELAGIVEGTDLGICFDIGHAHTTGQIDEMISLLRDRMVNVHIHDNNGERDEHLTIGDGTIDFDHVLSDLRGYAGNLIIESKSFESAAESKIRLERLL